MNRFFFFLALIITSHVKSQCFEIESILVDACDGSNEGQNEMVTFKIGNTALNTSNLTVDWPANTWRGICQNAGTASDIATANASILKCGYLKEPVGGVLRANSKVLLVTGTNWNPTAQSFANLNDTLIVIFQCYNSGNENGHFANHTSVTTPSTAIRTLSMSFSPTCKDAVSYDRNNLIKQNQAVGGEDGGAVEFSPSGIATYVNRDCQVPFIPLSVDAGTNKTICAGSTQNFTATVSGAYTSVNWSLGAGATGTFVPSNSLSTNYSPGVGDNGTIKLYCTILNSCGSQTNTVKDSVNLTIVPNPTISVDKPSPGLCTGESVTITATSSLGTYTWQPGGITTNTIVANSAQIYTVTTSNSCYTVSATSTVSINSSPALTISSTSSSLCPAGQTATLSITGSAGTYNWSDGSNNDSTIVNSDGVYTATVTTASCGSVSASYTIGAAPIPTITLSPSSTLLCDGATATLTAPSNMSNYSWSDGSINTNSIVVNAANIYTVGVSNACGSATTSINIQTNTTPTLVLVSSSNTLCPNQTATLTVTGGSSPYIWSNNSSNTGSVVTTTGGSVSVTYSNVCGTDTETVMVTTSSVNASISANPISGVTPLTVNFSNSSVGANSYTWTLGNGNTAVTQTIVAQTYTMVGNFMAYLTATDGTCIDTDSVLIHVLNEAPTLIIPNVFTPNGDSANDVFKVTGFSIVDFNCTIFDRWGMQMFYWNDITKGWDGKSSGKEVPDGTYFYIINAKDIDGKEIKNQGHLSLFK